jgi:hypothetical protein
MKPFSIVLAVVLAMGGALAAACSSGTAPSAPSAGTPSSTPPTAVQATIGYTLSGVLSDATSGQPIVGADISAWIQQGASGFSYTFLHGARHSEAGGRFQLAGLPAGSSVRVVVSTSGYVQQCAAPVVTVSADVQLDVQLVAVANVSSSRSPIAAPASGARSISGTIFFTTPAGPQPAVNAFVDFEPIDDLPAAATVTDAAGRYLLCGVPDGERAVIGATLNGRYAYVTVPPGQTTADVTLP